MLSFAIVKLSFVPILGPKKPKISRGKFLDNHLKKIMQKFRKLRKSCNNKRNISILYNEKLHYHCLQQLPTLRLFKTRHFRRWGGLCAHTRKKKKRARILGNEGIQAKGNEKLKLEPCTQSSH